MILLKLFYIYQKMISDAVNGKIDMIITKSISRFARNTLDTLKYVRLLKENNVDPGQIDIEITEYMFLDKSDKNYKLLNQLRAKNVTVSLDDFGTGYSSLSYLKEFPIDYLKIDKSFIDDYKNEQGAVFIDTIVKMGQTLNMKIIAEGVEEKEQVQYLEKIGCDQYQGYYFSRPLSVKDFENTYIKQA